MTTQHTQATGSSGATCLCDFFSVAPKPHHSQHRASSGPTPEMYAHLLVDVIADVPLRGAGLMCCVCAYALPGRWRGVAGMHALLQGVREWSMCDLQVFHLLRPGCLFTRTRYFGARRRVEPRRSVSPPPVNSFHAFPCQCACLEVRCRRSFATEATQTHHITALLQWTNQMSSRQGTASPPRTLSVSSCLFHQRPGGCHLSHLQ